ncbi:hypothetical protein K501DRAFT_266963 [Backusella circina FSU 941]|nr:hypothetical protein K501DRAFT_266963 [Backusella circina FSU 941]
MYVLIACLLKKKLTSSIPFFLFKPDLKKSELMLGSQGEEKKSVVIQQENNEDDSDNELLYVAAGEKNEDTICIIKGKLFVLGSQTWKERKVGKFHLNKLNSENCIVMHTDSVHHLILNLNLFPDTKLFIMH